MSLLLSAPFLLLAILAVIYWQRSVKAAEVFWKTTKEATAFAVAMVAAYNWGDQDAMLRGWSNIIVLAPIWLLFWLIGLSAYAVTLESRDKKGTTNMEASTPPS